MGNDKFIDDYLAWLKSNMTELKLENGITEITTPFLDKNNDYTQIYVERKGKSRLILSDHGCIIDELNMIGIEVKSKKRKEIVNAVLNRFGVKLIGETLTIECNAEDYPNAKHRLIQAMLAIDDLFYLSRPNIVSLFLEEVQSFFIENEIYPLSNISLNGIAGYMHNYEFALQKNKKNPERLIKVANNLSKTMTESILFAWNDTRAVRDASSILYAFINDENRVSDKNINALENYGVIPILWSDREEYLDALA